MEKRDSAIKSNLRRFREGVTKIRVSSVFESLIDSSEDDAEILDISQQVKPESVNRLEDYSFHEETDDDSGADEGLGSEIIDPKDIESKIEVVNAKQHDNIKHFSTQVLHWLRFFEIVIFSGWEFGLKNNFILINRGHGRTLTAILCINLQSIEI